MTATSHALTGALVATVVKQPLLAVPLAFLSHFVCDALPHFGLDLKFGSRQMYWWLAIDGTVACLAALFLLNSGVANPILLAVCGFVAMAPDFMWLYVGLKKIKPANYHWFTKFHSSIQTYQKVPGIAVDIIWSLAMLLGILKLQ